MLTIFNQPPEARLEAWYQDYELSNSLLDSNIIINTSNPYIRDKIILANNDNNNLDRIRKSNLIISRTPNELTDLCIPYNFKNNKTVIQPFYSNKKPLLESDLNNESNYIIEGDIISIGSKLEITNEIKSQKFLNLIEIITYLLY